MCIFLPFLVMLFILVFAKFLSFYIHVSLFSYDYLTPECFTFVSVDFIRIKKKTATTYTFKCIKGAI